MLRVCAWIALAALPAVARADPPKVGPRPATKAAPRARAEGKPREGKVLRFSDDVVIQGKVHKPSAFYVLQRSAVEYQWEQLREAFLPKILESVKAAPF